MSEQETEATEEVQEQEEQNGRGVLDLTLREILALTLTVILLHAIFAFPISYLGAGTRADTYCAVVGWEEGFVTMPDETTHGYDWWYGKGEYERGILVTIYRSTVELLYKPIEWCKTVRDGTVRVMPVYTLPRDRDHYD